MEEIYAQDLDLLGYEFEDETKTSVLASLYDMDRLKKQREENSFGIRERGFRIYMGRLYFVYKDRLLHSVVKKNSALNYVYENLYSPLKSRITRMPLNAVKSK